MGNTRDELNVAIPDVAGRPVSRRTMVKGVTLGAALAGFPGLLAACGEDKKGGGGGDTKTLNFYNWTAYIDDTSNDPDQPANQLTIPKFEKESGIKVNYRTYSSNEDLVAKLGAGKSDFDVVVPSDFVVIGLIAEKALKKIDKSKVPNVDKNMAEKYKDLYYDRGLEYSVPWANGNTGIGVNKDVVKETVTDAAIFGNPAYKGKMTLLDEPRSTIALALFFLGLDPTTGDEAYLDKAFAQLQKWKDNDVSVTSDYQDPLGAGDVVVAHAYSGDVFQQATQSGKNLEYVIPSQGGDQYVDSMVIPADAPHPSNALEFMNFVYTPEVSANLMKAITYRNGCEPAYALLPKEVRDNPVVFPPPDVEKRLNFINVDEKADTLWRKKWDKFMAS